MDDPGGRIVAEIADGADERPKRRWFPVRKRVWVPVLAGVLTIGIVVGVAALWDTAGSAQPAEPPRPNFLQRAADHLESRPTEPLTVPTMDQWRYSKVAWEFYDVYGETEPVQEVEDWLRADYKLAALRQDGEVVTHNNEGAGVADTDLFADIPELYTFLRDLPDDWKPPFESHPDIRWTTTVQILIDAKTYTYRGHRGLDREGMGNEKNPLGIDLTELRLDYGIVDRPGQLPQ